MQNNKKNIKKKKLWRLMYSKNSILHKISKRKKKKTCENPPMETDAMRTAAAILHSWDIFEIYEVLNVVNKWKQQQQIGMTTTTTTW